MQLSSPGSFGLSSDGVHWVGWLIDLHVECKSLDGEVHDDGEQGGEQRAQDVVLTAILADLDHLGDDEANNVHPRDGAGEGETRHDGVQGLRLELEGDT